MNDPQANSPVADLRYRSYDGPLITRRARWWIIARRTLLGVIRKPLFWVLCAVACFPWLAHVMKLYFTANLPAGTPSFVPRFEHEVLAGEFYQAGRSQAILVFLVALMIGSGSVAADNRANALLVYLSKPITRADYILGKLAAIMMAVGGVVLAPGWLFYLYCAASMWGKPEFTADPWLLMRLVAASLVTALVYGSVALCCSALSRNPRMAGAAFAAVFFLSDIASSGIWLLRSGGRQDQFVLLQHLSLDGIVLGLSQNIYQIDVHIRGMRRRAMAWNELVIGPPDFWWLAAIAVVVVAVSLWIAILKVRAVEVIRG